MATPAQPAPTPASRLEKLSAGVGRIPSPNRRLEAANALLEAIPAFAGDLRTVRGSAIRELKSTGLTWLAIGNLFEPPVTPQRAQQLAAEAS